MEHPIRTSLVGLVLACSLLSPLVSTALGAAVAPRVYLPVVSNGHSGAAATPTATRTASPSPTPTATPSRTPDATAPVTATGAPSLTPSGTPTGTATATPTGTATRTPGTTPTDTASTTPSVTPSDTPTGTATPVESFRATVEPSASQLQVGQTLVVTATVFNEGSGVSFGLPQYRLRVETSPGVEQDQAAPLLTPARPDPITHYVGISPGGSDSAVFTFQALRPGTFSFALTVSGEVCLLGQPGCAGGHWSGAGARSITVTAVEGSATPTPAPTGTATPTSTATAPATPTPTATAIPTTPDGKVSLGGAVALRPQSQPAVDQPQMYVIILDVSKSMALNINGQAIINGVTRQCAFGPNADLNMKRDADASACASVTLPTWSVTSEQRFSIVRQALFSLIDRLEPNDAVVLLPMQPTTLLTTSLPRWDLSSADGKTRLKNTLTAIKPMNFGTPAATALRKAYQFLTAPTTPTRAPDGRAYQQNVLLLVDGVANFYLDLNNGAYLANGATAGWENRAQDQPSCGYWVADEAECHIGFAATTTNPQLARPITAMVHQASELQQLAQIFVVALAGADQVGLDRVASSPYAPWLNQSPSGYELPEIMTAILSRTKYGCAMYAGEWVHWIDAAHLPDPQPEIYYDTVGKVILRDANGFTQATAAILNNSVTGELFYRFHDLPPGTYALSAYVLYKGDDGFTRSYNLIRNPDDTMSAVRYVTVSGWEDPQQLDLLRLEFNGYACDEAQSAP